MNDLAHMARQFLAHREEQKLAGTPTLPKHKLPLHVLKAAHGVVTRRLDEINTRMAEREKML